MQDIFPLKLKRVMDDATKKCGLEMSDNVDFTLTFFDAYVIYSICKADSHRKMWSERLAVTRENTPPGVRVIRDLWPRRPEDATQRSGRARSA